MKRKTFYRIQIDYKSTYLLIIYWIHKRVEIITTCIIIIYIFSIYIIVIFDEPWKSCEYILFGFSVFVNLNYICPARTL